MFETSAEGPSPVSFSEKLASSQAFAGLFKEGMALVEETAGYLDGEGRQDSKKLERSAALVVVQVVSRRRSPEMKQKFYELAATNLATRTGLDPADLIVSITENNDEDWSFGHGRAQFLTGELL